MNGRLMMSDTLVIVLSVVSSLVAVVGLVAAIARATRRREVEMEEMIRDVDDRVHTRLHQHQLLCAEVRTSLTETLKAVVDKQEELRKMQESHGQKLDRLLGWTRRNGGTE
jgi:hypothetical protein